MGKKTSIYIDDSLQKIIESRTLDETRQVSAIITLMAERYTFLCSKYMPKFTVDDWCFIFSALAGFPTHAHMIGMCKSMILQYESRYRTVSWQISKNFKTRITILSEAESVAVIDSAERFYLKNTINPDDNNYESIASIVGDENILLLQ